MLNVDFFFLKSLAESKMLLVVDYVKQSGE